MPELSQQRNYTITKAIHAIESLSISIDSFFKLAKSENCNFFVEIPDDFTAYIVSYGSPSDIFITSAYKLERLHELRSPRPIDEDIEYLCVPQQEAKKLAHKEQINKKYFDHVGKMRPDGNIDTLDIESYKDNSQDTLSDLSSYSEFVTFKAEEINYFRRNSSTEPPEPTSISISLESLLLRASDLISISQKLSSKRDLGKIKVEPWSSKMLLDLNEASTTFLSKSLNPDIKEIRKWFQKRWEGSGAGRDVIEQAANAVIPDQKYKDSPKRASISNQKLEKYNSYSSTALIIINEAAEKYWKESRSNAATKKFPKRNTVIDYLKEKGLTAKLAGAASSIIRPK